MARILVIDDYPAILTLLQLTLARAGHEVATAGDGESGLKLAGTMKPDLVLLDVDMPDGDGLAVCRTLKRDPAMAHIPVLMMTGRFRAKVLERSRVAGAFGVLPKPFRGDLLLEEIERATRLAE